jgi:hypothetical protein
MEGQTMLKNSTYDLMETAAVLSKGLHRYETFRKDAKGCRECGQIWSYMQQTDEEQLTRIVAHLKQHFETEVERKLVTA